MSTKDDSHIERMRHSAAHVLAMAIMEMFPDGKLAIGPTVEHGFYYDVDLPRTLIPEDLELLEEKMKKYIAMALPFEHYFEPKDKAIEFLKKINQEYKVEMAEALPVSEISFYKNGSVFVDMCEGPHVESTKEIGAFKLTKIAGAYWRGDEKNKMLQRIYGVCFETKQELDKYLTQQEEAKKRDHRLLGQQLKLFTSSVLVGAGLPLLQPKGAIIRRELEEYLWALHKDKGYMRVWTPHIAKHDLYVTSGHAEKFGDELFRVKGKEEDFIMKPMNCPHHMQIFADNQFSYRDMPIRYFEPATVYRDEKSGQLGGLTRVRAITQDDGHLFCRVSQIGQEIKTIATIIKEFYTTMGMMEGYWVRLSIRDNEHKEKYLGSDEIWNTAEGALKQVCEEERLPYKVGEGEAAFYGPKLDFMFKDAIGREWQLATIQCDFNLPIRFDLSFTNENGEKERPVVIHRAISGSLERFMGVMIEHFAGAFPTWLAPLQVQIIPIAETHHVCAQKVASELSKANIRVAIDDRNESLGKRIREAEMHKIPYMLVIGDKEMEQESVAVRNFHTKKQEVMKVVDFQARLAAEIISRQLTY
ncbi:MAG: threonine--tRNA ligase [Candidatus Abawacabacteria bacterium]|nr:threonine--tRNA ligase [Candidatus Abawacabacteria bacterium]